MEYNADDKACGCEPRVNRLCARHEAQRAIWWQEATDKAAMSEAMTPEREAEIRAHAKFGTGQNDLVLHDLLAALDAERAQRQTLEKAVTQGAREQRSLEKRIVERDAEIVRWRSILAVAERDAERSAARLVKQCDLVREAEQALASERAQRQQAEQERDNLLSALNLQQRKEQHENRVLELRQRLDALRSQQMATEQARDRLMALLIRSLAPLPQEPTP